MHACSRHLVIRSVSFEVLKRGRLGSVAPPFVFDKLGARVSLLRLDHPAIPAEEGLVQLAVLCTLTLTTTKEIDVLIVNMECHLQHDQVMT